jgi:hypothetical protein
MHPQELQGLCLSALQKLRQIDMRRLDVASFCEEADDHCVAQQELIAHAVFAENGISLA